MRFALGATRYRVVRQLIVEGALIGLAGAIAGIALAGMSIRAIMAALSTMHRSDRARCRPRLADGGVQRRDRRADDARVRAGSGDAGLRADATLRRRARSTGGRRRVAAREVLVSIQVAMSVVLLSAALLFVLTFRNLTTMDVGFAREDILVANVFLSESDHPPATRAAFQRDLTSRLAALPGVAAAARTRRRRRSAAPSRAPSPDRDRLPAKSRMKPSGTRSATGHGNT